ncbi:MAG: chloromuconate cycloisomerase [Tepidiforma sp.]|nr:MAG: chloromuconate cycloisomerase [Tepidiforma sp.]
MSRVAAARVMPYRLRLVSAHTDARSAFSSREGALLELTDAEGRTALGDCAPLPPWSPGLDVCVPELERRARSLIGVEPFAAFEEFSADLPLGVPGPVRAALEAALGFLAAAERRVPLGALLEPGRQRPDRLRVNALVDTAAPEEAVRAAGQAWDAGYRAFKVKLSDDAGRDAALLASLRQALGPHAYLRADANGAWSPEEALRRVDMLLEANVGLVEQPLPPGREGSLQVMRELRRRGVRVALDESLADGARGLALLDEDVCDAAVLKPSLLGLGAARRIARRAREAGLEVIVTGAFESSAGLGAALEFAAALGTGDTWHGFATALAVLDDPVGGAPRPSAGEVALPAAGVFPGLRGSPAGREVVGR